MFTKKITSLFKPLTYNIFNKFSVEAAKSTKTSTTQTPKVQSKPAQSTTKIGQISQVLIINIFRLLVQSLMYSFKDKFHQFLMHYKFKVLNID
jgi:hypothetical protein